MEAPFPMSHVDAATRMDGFLAIHLVQRVFSLLSLVGNSWCPAHVGFQFSPCTLFPPLEIDAWFLCFVSCRCRPPHSPRKGVLSSFLWLFAKVQMRPLLLHKSPGSCTRHSTEGAHAFHAQRTAVTVRHSLFDLLLSVSTCSFFSVIAQA